MPSTDLTFFTYDPHDADVMLNTLSGTFSGSHSVFSQGGMPTIFRPGTGVFISPFASEADAFYIMRHLTHRPNFKIRVGEDKRGRYAYMKLGEDRAIRQYVGTTGTDSLALRWAIVRACVQHLQNR